MTQLTPPTLDKVCEAALRLPCAPSLLPRLAVALQSDSSSAQEIERLISLDPSLAASTLRLANSAALSRRKVETVEEAVFRLGAKEIYRLAALALVSRWESQLGSLRWNPGDFSRHSLCTAIAAEVLAGTTERLEPQMAYTAGLVCDLVLVSSRPSARGNRPNAR
jgi:HD-like signal output (HDOD) protein